MAISPTPRNSRRTRTHLSRLGPLPSLSITSLTSLTPAQKSSIISATSRISHLLMTDLGVKWKPQPVDPLLRQRTIAWIKNDLELRVGPVTKRFLLSVDAGLTYTERVYEDGDFETRVAMVRYVSVAIWLDDLIDKDGGMAKRAESFLVGLVNQGGVGIDAERGEKDGHGVWLEEYRRASVELASKMSDPFVSNMLLHSCTLFIEGCALEYYIQRDEGRYFLIRDAETERARDEEERVLGRERGFEIPLPLDGDRVDGGSGDEDGDEGVEGDDYLVPHGWPIWLRERSAVAETFAITSFRAPGGVDVPTWLWVTAISEMRTIILSINDVLSFAKELLVDDTTSSIAVLTKERRMIGMPGTAPDGGWCLRDTFEEVFAKIHVAGARINRLLRPSTTKTRYGPDGRAHGIPELVEMLKAGSRAVGGSVSQEEIMKALVLKLWETHQRGYVAWHFECARYRTFELFDWVRDMMGGEVGGPEWLTSCFMDEK